MMQVDDMGEQPEAKLPPSGEALSIQKRASAVAGHLVSVLHELRLICGQAEKERPNPDVESPEEQVLYYAQQHIRKALGTGDTLGLLDFMGIESTEGWIDQAVVDGSYIVGETAYQVYRYDTDRGPLYSAKELMVGTQSFWHSNWEGAVNHMCIQLGLPPDAVYEFAPVNANQTA